MEERERQKKSAASPIFFSSSNPSRSPSLVLCYHRRSPATLRPREAPIHGGCVLSCFPSPFLAPLRGARGRNPGKARALVPRAETKGGGQIASPCRTAAVFPPKRVR